MEFHYFPVGCLNASYLVLLSFALSFVKKKNKEVTNQLYWVARKVMRKIKDTVNSTRLDIQ